MKSSLDLVIKLNTCKYLFSIGTEYDCALNIMKTPDPEICNHECDFFVSAEKFLPRHIREKRENKTYCFKG